MNVGDVARSAEQDVIGSGPTHPRLSELVGADILDLPRTASITITELDRAADALADSLGLYAESELNEQRYVRMRELRRMLLLISVIRDETVVSPGRHIAPALLTRTARCLDLAGDVCEDPYRSAMLHDAATALRSRELD